MNKEGIMKLMVHILMLLVLLMQSYNLGKMVAYTELTEKITYNVVGDIK